MKQLSYYRDTKETLSYRRDHYIKTIEQQNRLAEAIDKDGNWYDEFMELVNHYLDGVGDCGGNLHVILGDSNIDDHSIAWCDGYCAGVEDHEGGDIVTLLGLMTMEQRKRIFEEEQADG